LTATIICLYFKTLKVECIYRYNFSNKELVNKAVFDYIDGWYNTVTIHTILGDISPLQAYIEKSKYLKAA